MRSAEPYSTPESLADQSLLSSKSPAFFFFPFIAPFSMANFLTLLVLFGINLTGVKSSLLSISSLFRLFLTKSSLLSTSSLVLFYCSKSFFKISITSLVYLYCNQNFCFLFCLISSERIEAWSLIGSSVSSKLVISNNNFYALVTLTSAVIQ